MRNSLPPDSQGAAAVALALVARRLHGQGANRHRRSPADATFAYLPTST